MKKLLLYAAVTTLTFSIGFAAFAFWDSSGPRGEKNARLGFRAGSPLTRGKDLSAEPLLIEQVKMATSDHHASAITFKVRNVSNSPVRMYILRYVSGAEAP